MLVLSQIVNDASSNQAGDMLYNALVKEYNKGQKSTLVVDNDLAMSSSFLNSSIGMFLDNYGIDTFKNYFSFQGSKNQFNRLLKYLEKYREIHLDN